VVTPMDVIRSSSSAFPRATAGLSREDVLTYNAVDRDGAVAHRPPQQTPSQSPRRCSTGGSIRASAWPSSGRGRVPRQLLSGNRTVLLDVVEPSRRQCSGS
jgi:hypothetical protein